MVFNSMGGVGSKIFDDPVGFKVALNKIKHFLSAGGVSKTKIDKEVGNAYIYFAIRTMIRFFSVKAGVGLVKIHKSVFLMVNDLSIRRSLKYYFPSEGDSKILPVLTKYRLIWLIMVVCWYKVNVKFGRRKK